MARITVALLALIGALAGCGTQAGNAPTPDQKRVAEVVQRVMRDFGTGNATDACTHFSLGGIDRIAKAAYAAVPIKADQDCAHGLAMLYVLAAKANSASVRSFARFRGDPAAVTISGNTAIYDDGSNNRFRLVAPLGAGYRWDVGGWTLLDAFVREGSVLPSSAG